MLLLAGVSPAQATVAVPPALRDWQDWVLQDQPFRRCPLLPGQSGQGEGDFLCQAAGPLQLEVDAGGARFDWTVTLWREAEVSLPGEGEHWPQQVEVDGRAQPVLARQNRPVLRLPAGRHRINGSFSWSARPAQLALPMSLALVQLQLNGQRVPFPRRDEQGISLGRPAEGKPDTQADALALQAFRLIRDGLPLTDELRLQLSVSGKPREALIGPALLPGFAAMDLQGELGARLEADGRLRVQLRPGRYELRLYSRATALPAELQRPVADSGWPATELWSWQGDDSLRAASLDGGTPVDPGANGVPGEWQQLPTLAVVADSKLSLSERQRGRADGDNPLQLARRMWLRFDGSGWSFIDTLSGQMHRDWRLELAAPYQLLAAESAGRGWPVTRSDTGTGIEWRSGDVNVEASGTVSALTDLGVSGWSQTMQSVSWELQLPPGSLLVATAGAETDRSSWLARWNLLDCFVLVLSVVLVRRLFGWAMAACALAGLGWLFHTFDGGVWLYAHAGAALLSARFVHSGKLASLVRGWAVIAVVLLAIALLPFTVTQVRGLLHPQLEAGAYSGHTPTAGEYVEMQGAPMADAVEEMASAAPAPVSQEFARKLLPTKPAIRPLDDSTATARTSAGLGQPDWQWRRHHLEWSSPVTPEQGASLWVLSGWAYKLVQLTALLLVLAVSVRLLSEAFRQAPRRASRAGRGDDSGNPGNPGGTDSSDGRLSPATLGLMLPLAALGLTLLALAGPRPAQAAEALPSPELLQELKTRLSQPPKCAPDCLSLARAELRADADGLRLLLDVHAAHAGLLPLPGLPGWPTSVALVGRAEPAPRSAALHRLPGGALQVAVEAGISRIELSGPLPSGDRLRLGFPLPPRELKLDLQGWSALPGGREAVELVRERGASSAPADATAQRTEQATAKAAGKADADAPQLTATPMLRVHRTLQLGRTWEVQTTVERLAPRDGAFTASVRLLDGEQPLSAGLKQADGAMQLSFGPGEQSKRWQSRLNAVDRLELRAPDSADQVEIWSVAADLRWRVTASGTPEVAMASVGVPRYAPRPGETLTLAISEPEVQSGKGLAIDRLEQQHQQGSQQGEGHWLINWRSTQGGDERLQLPEGIELLEVQADEQLLAVKAQDGVLTLPTQPGEHRWLIRYRDARGAALGQSLPVLGLPVLGLPVPAANVHQTLTLADNRWLLWTRGPTLGPAVLYWSALLVFAALALALSRQHWLPLNFRDALLLGLGLSTVSWWVLGLSVGWLALVRWRATAAPAASKGYGQLRQFAVLAVTAIAVLTLISVVPEALLSQPDMMLTGNHSAGQTLNWFSDYAETGTPAVLALSVPLWIYKAAMLLWAIWLSFALIRWVRLSWEALQTPASVERPAAEKAAAKTDEAAVKPAPAADAAPESTGREWEK